MADDSALRIDVLIYGGGIAGLWALDELTRQGYQCLLLEKSALGEGQTISSQGIIHGGMKYSLTGFVTKSAKALSDMPTLWRECLAGSREPGLEGVRPLSDHCVMWQTQSLKSKAGFLGAKMTLRSTPRTLTLRSRPAILGNCDGEIVRIDEPVIDPADVLEALANRHADRIIRYDEVDGIETATSDGRVNQRIADTAHGRDVTISSRVVILLAGGGNEQLRRQYDLELRAMQRRPLQMVMMRGPSLPKLFGHCVDGMHTRITVTTNTDSTGRTVWQVGGQLAEDGAHMLPDHLIERACSEITDCIPGFQLTGCEMATYPVDRAEAHTRGRRPAGSTVLSHDSIITGWPTKLAMTPVLVRDIARHVNGICKPDAQPDALSAFAEWKRPNVATHPWETVERWTAVN